MDFALNEDQLALQASVREFLAERYPVERVAAIADGDGFDAASWKEVASLGWTGVSLPEDAGGLDLGFVEEAVVLEQLGRALFPGPFFSSVTLALPALSADRELAERVASGTSAATLAWAGADGEFRAGDLAVTAERGGDGWTLSGTATFVPDLAVADLVVVAAQAPDEPGLYAVEREGDGVAWESLPTVDATRPVGRLALDGAAARQLVTSAEAEDLLDDLRDRALAGLAAEAVGVASRALDMAVEYAGAREQFGRPIGVYQAISHSLADGYVDVESARSLAYWAAWAVANGTDDAPDAAAAAKAAAAEAAVACCERAIQVHGGIGFTWEHPLHRFYKRALWIAAFMGWPAEHRRRIAASLLDRPPPG
jgi:alkylation response protein AidB-like acyl-CoA dehydrogenase